MNEIEQLPRLIQRAVTALNKATTAAEVLEAKEHAGAAYDAAKRVARLERLKDAHGEILRTCRKMQADALMIEARAQCRLVDEYEAAQERGEALKSGERLRSGRGRGHKGESSLLEGKRGKYRVADIGLTDKQVYDARKVSAVERASPGVLRKTLDDLLAAGGELTRKGVLRAAEATVSPKPKPAGDEKPKPPLRGESLELRNEKIVALFDRGLTPAQVAVETDVHLRNVHQILEHERIRREAQAEPIIDPSTLSKSAQEKLAVAIRQHQRRLDLEFEQRLGSEIKRRVDEMVLPSYNESKRHYDAVLSARKGILKRVEFNKLLRCLHTDTARQVSDEDLNDALNLILRHKVVLLCEADEPTATPPLPKTYEELMALKQKVSEERRAARQAARANGGG